jgi:serine protease
MSLPHGLTGRVIAAVVTASAIAAGLLFKSSVQAQTPLWTPPYSMILTPARALSFVQAANRKLDYVPGEVLVKFKGGVTATGQQRALMALRSRPAVSELRWIADGTAVLRDSTEPDGTILAAQLGAQPEVEYAEPNYLYHLTRTPNDPSFVTRQWNFTAIDLPRAWDINDGATANTIVAVVDSGITTVTRSFDFLTWNGTANQSASTSFDVNVDLAITRLVSAKDFVFWNGPVLDMVGHGTHVASTIGEDTNNSLGEAGIAYKAKIMPVKICVGYWEIQFVLSSQGYRGFAPKDAGGCDTGAIAQGIRYAADNGAKVINLSLGGPAAATTVQDALSYAVGKGAFIAIAAGNEFDSGNPVEYPAGYAPGIDGVMSVGSVGPSLTRAFYSNTGSYLEISAPGGNSREGGASGEIWQSTICQGDSASATVIFPRFDRYCEVAFQGTSMATPHVAGIGALIISQGVTNPAAVEALIKKTARPLGAAGRNDEYGYGLIQPRAALFGFGISK